MSTLTLEQQFAIADFLRTHRLPKGMGTEEAACSIAAINLALSGKLTDDVPDCMSLVIGRWIIGAQDAMPDGMRNSDEWKSLLPLAAGTGRAHERERLAMVMDWMWGTVLPSLQRLADERGFGAQWKRMTDERTHLAAAHAADAARARAADYAAYAAAYADYADYAAHAADVARAADYAARAAAMWQRFDPCGLLRRLIEVGEPVTCKARAAEEGLVLA
jgi:hypothetical protein